MKVLLINPPFTDYGGLEGHGGKTAPLNLGYLAAYLRSRKPEVDITILDCEGLRLSYDKIEGEISHLKPDIVGITAPTPAFAQVLEISQRIRKLSPDIKIVVGGPHPSAFPEKTALESTIDFVVYGEGEVTFTELVDAVDHNKNLESIAGLAFRNGNGNVKLTNPRPLIDNLDRIPFPARDLLPLDIYFPPPTRRISNKEKAGNMITSRGCPYKCTYCMVRQIWTQKVRFRSPKNTVDEIEECLKKYGIGEFNFHDDLFTCNRKRTIEICQEIQRRKLDVAWVCVSRVDYMWEDMLIEMRKAGCGKVVFGFESGSQKILDSIKKQTTVERAKEAVKLVKKVGIKTAGNFMFGNIGETEETIRQSIDLAKELNTDTIAFFIATPYPGTEFYDKAIQMGLMRNDYEWKDFAILSKNKPVIELPGLSCDDLIYWQKRAYREYYIRLRYILEKLFGIRSFEDIKNIFYGTKLLLRIEH